MIQNILIIDNEISICMILAKFLNKNGYNTEYATSGKDALAILKKQSFKLALCDYQLGDMTGDDLFKKMQEICPETIVIFISGYGNIQTAVNVMKNGAFDFLTKPLFPDQVLSIIQKAFSNIVLENEQHSSDHYVRGESKVAQKLYTHVDLVAPTDYSVVIFGETGTGKEALAKLIAEGSARNEGPFISVDCGCISKELAASELFGHEKGAFTGANEMKVGAFELANGGTLFLDEIGNLSYDVQAFLLRALQEKRIRRVGGIKEIKVDVRIVAATNEDLFQAVKDKAFREDLYYRLNEFTLEVPPLRYRKDDIHLFVDEFIRQASEKLGRKIKGMDDATWKLFLNYSWPGNIRELQNVIKRACLLVRENGFINEQTLPFELLQSIQHDDMESEEQTNEFHDLEIVNDLKQSTNNLERQQILTVLQKVNFNKSKAAQILNIDRKTLYNKMKKMEL